jgi:hypothetical protein
MLTLAMVFPTDHPLGMPLWESWVGVAFFKGSLFVTSRGNPH